jgi:hypothetical protein
MKLSEISEKILANHKRKRPKNRRAGSELMKIGRNQPCTCGSGKKYKKCCLDSQSEEKAVTSSGANLNLKGKNAEQLVRQLAEKSFFIDWCFANPKRPSGKELCDLLVVYDNVAIIWQIKDLKLDENGKYNKREVEKNIRQLPGARRQLFDLKTQVELENPRRRKEVFDPSVIKEIYLISVILGEGEDYGTFMENYKNHQVHVFNSDFLEIVLKELDTIGDFTHYLRTKEIFLSGNGKHVIILGGEQELLANYLWNGRSLDFIDGYDFIAIEEGAWEKFEKNHRNIARKREDEISYGWDGIIQRAHEGSSEYEIVARELARPNRFERRCLSKSFYDSHVQAHKCCEMDGKVIFRRLQTVKDTTYCYLFVGDDVPRDFRIQQLEIMCSIARGKVPENEKVIGIATEGKFRPDCAYDFCLLIKEEWTEEDKKWMENEQNQWGIFMSEPELTGEEHEFPHIDH